MRATCFDLLTGHHQAFSKVSLRCCFRYWDPNIYICKLAASQAKSIHLYKNLRAKVQRCCSNIYFNRQCLKLGLIPMYAQFKIPHTSPASIITQNTSTNVNIGIPTSKTAPETYFGEGLMMTC